MDSEKIVLASFTISPPAVHLRNGVSMLAKYTVEGDHVNIDIQDPDGEWKRWGWVDRELFEEASSKSLPIVYKFDTEGRMKVDEGI